MTATKSSALAIDRKDSSSSRRVEEMRRRFQLSNGVETISPRRGGERGRSIDVRKDRAGSLRTGAESVSRRFGRETDIDHAAKKKARLLDRSRTTDPTSRRRIAPPIAKSRLTNTPVRTTPVGTVATVLPPVSHTHHAAVYYPGYSYGYGYPGFGFSFGYSWCSPWYSWSCSPYSWYGSYCSPRYGWGWGYPYHSVCYASPYHYRYRCSPYYGYAPRYRYYNSYYAFTPLYGFVPYYQSSYLSYQEYSDSPVEIVLEAPQAERDLSAGELHFCEGWSLLRASAYGSASQVLYTASIELENSPMVHWFLTLALAGNDDLDLAELTLAETLRLDPIWLRHRWDAAAHLGPDAGVALREKLVAARLDDPTAPGPLAIEACLALLAGDDGRLEELRGSIAESLILNPDSPGLAEALAEVRRRESVPAGVPAGHPDEIESAWLAQPSCESIPGLDLRGQ